MKSALVVVSLLALGCQSARDHGRSLFNAASLSSASSNPFACSTCHETAAAPALLHPGYTMFDAAARPAYWGGTVTTLFDAVNQCVTNFMRGKALDLSNDDGRAIHAYLGSLAPDGSAPLLPLTVVQNIVDVPSGDAGAGATVWKQACAGCHGDAHTGKGRLSDVVSLVPDDSIAAHGTDPRTGARPVVIEKVRHGKFFNVGGNMPLFSVEALSDAELGTLLGYLEMFGLPKSQ